ncbi:hypothetical protein [Gymnodinialimonas sp. 57CJ19]|uniref:hypothetical protein n=1 Tax=Gymnodinialimonas sp. 57CJ19 TaxID=3138498 RepID=UPI0031344D13
MAIAGGCLPLASATLDRPPRPDVATCVAAPTAQCLTDVGIALALRGRDPSAYGHQVDLLAAMGRFDQALTLRGRLTGSTPEPTAAEVGRSVASHRVTHALAAGMPLADAVAQTPGADGGTLYISALSLLGGNPYGTPLPPRPDPTPEALATVADMADTIMRLATADPAQPRIYQMLYAAELHARLGNADAVVDVLAALPPTDTPPVTLPTEVMALIGSDRALRLFRAAGGGGDARILLRAAAVEPDPARAAEHLQTAFAAFAEEQPWPDHRWMAATTRAVADLGLADVALQMARDLDTSAQTDPAFSRQFAHIAATQALIDAQAPEAEVRAALARAEAGISPRSRPGNDARRALAQLRARLGDVAAATRWLDGIDRPSHAWGAMFGPDVPDTRRDALLEAAQSDLSPGGGVRLRAQVAEETSRCALGRGRPVGLRFGP